MPKSLVKEEFLKKAKSRTARALHLSSPLPKPRRLFIEFELPSSPAKTSVHVPLDCPPGPGPPSGASLGGPTMGQIGWGGPSTGPIFFLVQQGCLRVGVSRCGLAAVVGGGIRCFVGVNLSPSSSHAIEGDGQRE